jgi:hypothetical protein
MSTGMPMGREDDQLQVSDAELGRPEMQATRPKLSLVAENVKPYGIDIYVGGMQGASDIDMLRAHNITTVINCAVNLDLNYISQPLSPAEQTVSFGFGDVRYYKLGLIDGPGNPETMMLAGYYLLKGALEQRLPDEPVYPRRESGNVLVNCRGGRSRSVTLVALFLSIIEPNRFGTLETAIRYVREKRQLQTDILDETPKPILLEAARRARSWIAMIEAESSSGTIAAVP